MLQESSSWIQIRLRAVWPEGLRCEPLSCSVSLPSGSLTTSVLWAWWPTCPTGVFSWSPAIWPGFCLGYLSFSSPPLGLTFSLWIHLVVWSLEKLPVACWSWFCVPDSVPCTTKLCMRSAPERLVNQNWWVWEGAQLLRACFSTCLLSCIHPLRATCSLAWVPCASLDTLSWTAVHPILRPSLRTS